MDNNSNTQVASAVPQNMRGNVHDLARASVNDYGNLRSNHRQSRADAERQLQETRDAGKTAHIKLDELYREECERHERVLRKLDEQRQKIDEFVNLKSDHFNGLINYHRTAEELL